MPKGASSGVLNIALKFYSYLQAGKPFVINWVITLAIRRNNLEFDMEGK